MTADIINVTPTATKKYVVARIFLSRFKTQSVPLVRKKLRFFAKG
jgi:hypothetical protein